MQISKALNSSLLAKLMQDETKFVSKSGGGGGASSSSQQYIDKSKSTSSKGFTAHPPRTASSSSYAPSAQIGKLENQIHLLKQEVTKYQNQAQILRTDLKVAKYENEQYPQKIKSLESSVRNLEKDLQSRVEAFEHQVKLKQLAENNLQLVQRQLEEAKRVGPATNGAVTTLQDRVVKATKDKLELESANAQLKRELEQEKKNASQKEERSKKEVQNLVNEVSQLRDTVVSQKQIESNHLQQIESLKNQIAKLEKELQIANEKNQTLEEEKKAMRRELMSHTGNNLLEAQTRAKELEKEDLSLQLKLQEIQKELETVRASSEQNQKDAVERVATELNEKIATLEKTSKEQHVHILRLQRESAHDKTAGQERAEKERDGLKSENEALQQKLRDIEKQLAERPAQPSGPPPAPPAPAVVKSGGPPPPPPMSGMPVIRSSGAPKVGGGTSALFADISRGGFKLRKVPKTEMKRPVSPKKLAQQKAGGAKSGGFAPTGNPFMDELRKKQASLRK